MTRSLHAMVQLRRWMVALMMVLVSLPALAQQSPEQMIRDSIDGLMGKIDGRESYYMEHPQELKQVVDDSLRGVADFRYIGASVMGRYFNNATPQQRSRFVDVFKQTLLDTYAKGLVTFEYDSIRVLDNQSAARYEDQASVDMEVVATDGTVYPVSYTLRQSNGKWQVVNVIVNGINLGLTFRNQFDQAMRQYNRDYDAVINNWSPDVGVDELERGA
ncbi:ABC transporter substrate-binding protein [Halomonas denitrificans]|uniref:MlaC/ttg2D family ABC transporter substrate-binding protein n=1 Tax=Halomonas TaxID=2745 RepID=UPI001C94752E|nr:MULTISPECIES: ABC transporter substrate-binding protein [Halomonas]MED5296750.1 ABC transporter substrate-binding protein [Pseudomonadota bacterium]MBY5925630.1 ABC transporter substrate-binding protein [Halomonas sp. DP4Y7-2]MBY5930612.1 ABC transporter substrate-binding protein [Halomonas sp. DP8Y7-3]MBY5969332.1 ABC transporter substrate-binding protein [Halomonas denitrificans]MBY5984959.1 ABC transporter substrate-binding protein [Halomonas sp. DP5Y7-2]